MYHLVMYRNAHHGLTTVNMHSVSQVDDTGKHRLPEMIEAIATRTDFEVRSLVPIYQSYNAVTLRADCSAAQLRDAIRARPTKDLTKVELCALITDVALDENESISTDSDSDSSM